jgi:predicted nucleotide-binding protein
VKVGAKMKKDNKVFKKNRCFIVTPFDPAGFRIRDAISRALREISIEVTGADQMPHGESLIESITQSIESADIIIADLTRQNPNVMYEVGFAHALRKPTLIIVSKEQKKALPSNLMGWLFIVYDPSNLRSLQEHVIRFASEYIVRVRRESDE